MTRVMAFLARARMELLREQGAAWATRGLAVAGVAGLAFEVAMRVRPVDPWWPGPAACVLAGLLVAVAGWLRAWPSWARVAMVADLRLGGRERLVTALELAGASASAGGASTGALVQRQRRDAIAFAESADVRDMRRGSLPWRMLGAGGAAALAAIALAVVPNPALTSLRQQHAQAAAREQTAQQIQRLAQQATATPSSGGETPAQRQALGQQLQQAATNVRRAPDAQSAVAALTQAQQQLRSLADPNQAAKQDASAAAGQQLAQNPAAARAGQAMAAGDDKGAAGELQRLAQSVPQMTPSDQQALAQQLQQAAAAAQNDPKLAQALQKASQSLQQGNARAAQQALQQAAAQESALGSEQTFEGDINQATNALQQAKQPLAGQAAGQQSGQQGGSGQQAGAGQSGSNQQGAGGGQQGAGGGSGGGQGQGPGSGQGGGQGGSHQQGAGGNEKIYVPGQAQNPSGQGQQGQPAGTQPTQLVPYDQVYGQYRDAAVNQVDRADIPEDERQLVQQYFSNLGNGS